MRPSLLCACIGMSWSDLYLMGIRKEWKYMDGQCSYVSLDTNWELRKESWSNIFSSVFFISLPVPQIPSSRIPNTGNEENLNSYFWKWFYCAVRKQVFQWSCCVCSRNWSWHRKLENKKQQRIRYHLKNPAPNLHPLLAIVGARILTTGFRNQIISYFTSLEILLNESKL